MTQGEFCIAQILAKAGLPYKTEKTFEDLRDGRFRFDFYLPNTNTLIEVDGKQHFTYIPRFHHSRADFLRGQEHDRRKNSYALANNMPLYRLPFWELESIKTLDDIFTDSHLVKTRWHNDDLWNAHKN